MVTTRSGGTYDPSPIADSGSDTPVIIRETAEITETHNNSDTATKTPVTMEQ